MHLIKLSRLLFYVFPALVAGRIIFPFQLSKKFDFVLSLEMLGCSALEEWSDFYCLICCAAKSSYFLHSVEIAEVSLSVRNLREIWKCTVDIFIKCSWKGNGDFFWLKNYYRVSRNKPWAVFYWFSPFHTPLLFADNRSLTSKSLRRR